MAERVCPWWIGYLLACPIRKLVQDPRSILAPYVHEGMTVLEPGPGMGFFTLELARLVGPSGRVVAVDIQPKMLARLMRRAGKAGVAERVSARLANPDSMGLDDLAGQVDVAVAFAVVHEMRSEARFFQESAAALKPGGLLLLAEPTGHVTTPKFEGELRDAAAAGLSAVERPIISRSHAAVLKKL
jgi:ubiquinone/menaquinone biosynthesis C-methylase UbiE